ncbi:MAG TPA: GNAT family N-acetyltransferase [Anaerolineales bacterium]|nr:GNAT family N-acetyltransferase [Anaerolineales bacterium]
MVNTQMKPHQPTIVRSLQLRPVTMDDMDRVLGLVNAFSRHYLGVDELDKAEVCNFWSAPGLNMAEDLRLLVTAEGEALGYVECASLDSPPVHHFIWLRVHPEYLSQGLEERLIAWAEQRAHSMLELCPPDLRVSIQTFIPAQVKPYAAMLESHSYALIRHSFMMAIKLAEAPIAPAWSLDFELRPFIEEGDLQAVYQAYDEAFSDHYGHVKRPFEASLKRFRHMLIEDETYDPGLWFLAWDGDEVAGLSLCFPHSSEDLEMGWLALPDVPRRWRKRGLGKALLLHTFEEFRKRGQKRVGLGVDASNLTGAVKLYEDVGMHVARQYDRYEKELRSGKELMTTELS